jgi:nucleotide-binding universal stress UspA family protein
MRVLVFVDELPSAREALALADLLARHFPVELTLLTTEDAGGMSLLDQAGAHLTAPVTMRLSRDGNSEEAIGAESKDGGYDLIVVAPAGRRGLNRLLHGSRVANVVKAVTTSVVIARQTPQEVRRIVVGVTGAPHSAVDVRVAARLAQAFSAEVTVLHIVSQVPLVFTGLAQMRYNLDRFLDMDAPVAQQLKRAREVLAEYGVLNRIELREGLVRDEIIDEVVEGKHDLLVAGAHVHEGMVGRLLDDIADHLVRECPISTLVVRGEPQWTEDGQRSESQGNS